MKTRCGVNICDKIEGIQVQTATFSWYEQSVFRGIAHRCSAVPPANFSDVWMSRLGSWTFRSNSSKHFKSVLARLVKGILSITVSTKAGWYLKNNYPDISLLKQLDRRYYQTNQPTVIPKPVYPADLEHHFAQYKVMPYKIGRLSPVNHQHRVRCQSIIATIRLHHPTGLVGTAPLRFKTSDAQGLKDVYILFCRGHELISAFLTCRLHDDIITNSCWRPGVHWVIGSTALFHAPSTQHGD